MSLFNKLSCELVVIIFKQLPRPDRTNLYLLFSQGGFRSDLKVALDKVAKIASDPVVKWEWVGSYANTDQGDRISYLVNTDPKKKTLGILPDKSKSLLPTRDLFREDGRPTSHSVVCRWNGEEAKKYLHSDRKKELFIRTFEEDNYEEYYHDVLVIYLNPMEEIFWKHCDANVIPGEALAVDKSAQDELLFFGFRTGNEEVDTRLGYIRAGKGLMHHHHTGDWGEEIRWEVSEGFFVLCAREKLFEPN
eukprot:GFUD01025259.1.p1 GENE.GFUD01025259.1~~GFUD01025259.1.p1  ORF type:complete len:248 (-),score=57.83 GFUD01025259.1:76-819(-)